MRIQVRSAPNTMSTEVGKSMVGVIFTDATDRTLPGAFFVPMENVLLRMPRFEDCAEFSPFMEGIYLPKESCVVV
jgi:hypothetical protein